MTLRTPEMTVSAVSQRDQCWELKEWPAYGCCHWKTLVSDAQLFHFWKLQFKFSEYKATMRSSFPISSISEGKRGERDSERKVPKSRLPVVALTNSRWHFFSWHTISVGCFKQVIIENRTIYKYFFNKVQFSSLSVGKTTYRPTTNNNWKQLLSSAYLGSRQARE